MKDRAALQIIRDAEGDGRLQPGQTVVEMTSGNMGAGLAVVCAATGHRFVAVMSSGNSPARKTQMEGLGAEVVLVDQIDGSPGRVTGADINAAVEKARLITIECNGFYVDQFNNASGIRAHETTTGPEIWKQTNGKLDAFVCVVGTAGSLVGTSKFLRSKSKHVSIEVVEPEKCQVLAGRTVESPRHVLQGTSYGFVPPHCRGFAADGFLAVSDEEAIETQRQLGSCEGVFVGPSSAANVCAAMKLAVGRSIGENPTILTLLCDSGLKYL
jgi:cysteine synthase A